MDTLYFDYASGALSEPARLLVDTQLNLRPELRREVALWEALGGLALEADAAAEPAAAPVPTGAGPQTPRPRSPDLPYPLAEEVGRPLAAMPWTRPAPGVAEFVMPRWPQARVLRLDGPDAAAGWSLGPELVLVLDGALTLDGRTYGPGETLAFDRSEQAPEPAGPCLYFSVQESGYSVRDVRSVVERGAAAREWAWRPA